MNHIKPPKIMVNAEFQRLLWLNLNWGMAVGIFILYGLFAITKREGTEWSEYVIMTSMFGLALSALAGYILIERSFKQDISSNTFDQLRMSSLSAWQMAYSRVLAAPILAWVGFSIGWLVLGLGVLLDNGETPQLLYSFATIPFTAWTVACLIVVNALQFGRGPRQYTGSILQLILLYIVCMVFFIDFSSAVSEAFYSEESRSEFYSARINYDITNMPLELLISAGIGAVFSVIAVYAAMAWKLYLQSPRRVFLILTVLSPILYWWALADKNVFWWMASVNYSGLALVSLVVQDFRFQSLSKKVRWYDIPAWWVLLPLAIISSFMLAGGVLLIPFIQIGCLVCILFICCNMRATHFNSITLGLSVFLLARSLWALAF